MPPTQGTDNRIIIEDLKNEIQALKSRCNVFERTVEDLQCRLETHKKFIEGYREEIVRIQADQGTLNVTYEGEHLELMER